MWVLLGSESWDECLKGWQWLAEGRHRDHAFTEWNMCCSWRCLQNHRHHQALVPGEHNSEGTATLIPDVFRNRLFQPIAYL